MFYSTKEKEKNMKCKNCGNELMDGAVFCQACGTKQDEPAEVKQEETKAEEAAKTEEKPVEEKKEESAPQPEAQAQPQPEVQAQAPVQPQPEAQAQQAQGKKKPILPIILGIVGALVVVLLVVLGIKFIGSHSSKGNSTAVAYVSKGTLCIIKDASAKDPKVIEVMDLDIDIDLYYLPYNFITWSSDQKTIYFFDDVDEDRVGDLCCVQIAKLGKDKAKNESKVVVIDDNVYISSLSILDNGKLLYLTAKDKVCIYGGKEPEELAKDVDNFYKTDDSKGILYLADPEEEGSTLYYMPISGGDAVEIDDEVDSIYHYENDSVFYKKTTYDSENYTYEESLFVSDFDGNVTEISELVDSVGPITDAGFYYTEVIDDSETLYDFIDDPYASSDASAEEPVYPGTEAGFVAANVEDVFDEYKLGRITKKFNGDPVAYMEDNCWSYTYGDREYYYIYNSDTYEDYYYDIEAGVYYRYDSDVMQDARDKYYEDSDKWYEIQNRIYLRESLKEYEVNPGYVTLYYYHDGASEEIVSECKDVSFAYIGLETPMAFYHEASTDSIEKLSIDEIDYAWDAYDQLFGYSAQSDFGDIFYAIGKDADLELGQSGSIGTIGGSSSENRVCIRVTDEDADSEYILYTLKGTDLTQDEKFDDEAEVVSAFKDGKVYFIKNVSDYGETGDLYIYDGKDTAKVLKNISLYNSGYIFETGSIVCYDDDGKAVLYSAAGDEIVKLGVVDSLWHDVNYINDKKVIFLADGKLCFYNGKETVKIATRVDYVRFVSTSGTTLSTYYYSY